MDDVIERLYAQFSQTHAVTTDSRAITPGCIFFAFKGNHFDGNAFANQALSQGAALCVVSDSQYASDSRCVLVSDVLVALQQLATYYRSQLTIPVVGITGTNGKTTTKELVREVLSRRYRVHATQGNYNNHIGVPLTILSTPVDTEILIVEMGASHIGEIADLCAIAQPTVGLITNCGKAHLEGFGSFENVVHTKTDLYRSLAANHGVMVVNADDTVLMQAATALTEVSQPTPIPSCYMPSIPSAALEDAEGCAAMVTYGNSSEAEVKGSLMPPADADLRHAFMRYYFELGDQVYTIQSQLTGAYNFSNAMAATAIGLYFKVEPFDIKDAVEHYQPSNNRSQYKQTARNQLILDCYNANPSSMAAAIQNFSLLAHPHKVAVLGEMRELGAASEKEHQVVVNQIVSLNPDAVYLVGEAFAFASSWPNVTVVSDTDELIALLLRQPISDALLLVKGSNSNKLWTIEPYL
ncbi:MAG: UDP-N-acetylmuramoyl-tripeptide--D-alanyl-D-alanine ligase [Bacteroidales bacterium]|nr:UDP-N-acetylmuramoyl-tripeptide--D-alanyl-D-alanine ligase [Candidatus Colimorpha onthohippi]